MEKYILYWGDGDDCTWHVYNAQPFITDDIDSWEYNLIKAVEECKEKELYPFIYNKIELPIFSKSFSYEIMTLEEWFDSNLPR